MNKFVTVDEFLNALDGKQLEQVTSLRQLILDAHPELSEHIKWNSPSYVLNNEDRITFSVRPGYPISIVLHMGATRPENKDGAPVMDDPSGLIEWKSDTRGVISFADIEDVQLKSTQLSLIIDKWLKLAE